MTRTAARFIPTNVLLPSSLAALGYDPGSLAGKDLYMLKLENPNVSIASGNEGGASSLWKPGGLTDPGGMREAVLNKDIGYLMSTQRVIKLP